MRRRAAHSMCFGTRLCGVPLLTPLCLVVRVRGISTSNQMSLSIFAKSERDRFAHGTIFSLFPIALLKPECEMQRPEEINDNAHAVFHFRIPACGQSGACQ